ncbi:killer cell lectin-like receptor subfamily F member 1 isoform X2 [Mauremys reevesii]|uniref:killer cell lectin-like receptor subfamily F member 1 isoform X2 n=1 Tax=Mauremys reevesii TaxID=260615 RepID=UPI00193F676A|nr:killer cell lectin-like receptor subfamily F member 1 isoform X2 [Mauremys reevesii]
MTEEIIYADINVLEDASPACQPSSLKHHDLRGFARRHGFVLWIALAGDVILATAVIALGVQDGSSCKLCPMDWLSRRGKCYWFSKDSKNWTESRADCSAKSSRKLVLQDQEEMEFIQNVTQGKYYVWLGLSVPSAEKDWTWVDNSVLDQTLFPVTSPTDVNSCGVIKGNRIHSETCSAEFKWICQKEAVLL